MQENKLRDKIKHNDEEPSNGGGSISYPTKPGNSPEPKKSRVNQIAVGIAIAFVVTILLIALL